MKSNIDLFILTREKLEDKIPLFIHRGGSYLYGTTLSKSDDDIRGVFLSPKDYWVGAKVCNNIEFQGAEADIQLWDIRNFIKNIFRASPNILETLFVEEDNEHNILQTSQIWRDLKPKIYKLINQSVYQAFKGYSTAQIKKNACKTK